MLPAPSCVLPATSPENSALASLPPASPACSRKIRSSPPAAHPAGSQSAIPPPHRPARYTATSKSRTPPATSCTASPDSPDSTSSAPPSAPPSTSPDTLPLRTSAPPDALDPSATPAAPVSLPAVPSSTLALPPALLRQTLSSCPVRFVQNTNLLVEYSLRPTARNAVVYRPQ